MNLLDLSPAGNLNPASNCDLGRPPAPPPNLTTLTLDEPDGSQRELRIEYHTAGCASFHPETGGPHFVIDKVVHGGLEICLLPDTQNWILRGLHELESFAADPEPEDFA